MGHFRGVCHRYHNHVCLSMTEVLPSVFLVFRGFWLRALPPLFPWSSSAPPPLLEVVQLRLIPRRYLQVPRDAKHANVFLPVPKPTFLLLASPPFHLFVEFMVPHSFGKMVIGCGKRRSWEGSHLPEKTSLVQTMTSILSLPVFRMA